MRKESPLQRHLASWVEDVTAARDVFVHAFLPATCVVRREGGGARGDDIPAVAGGAAAAAAAAAAAHEGVAAAAVSPLTLLNTDALRLIAEMVGVYHGRSLRNIREVARYL